MNPGAGTNDDLYSKIGPGFAAFVVIFLLALAVWWLARSMNSHLRTVRYRQADEEMEMRAAQEQGGAPGDLTAGESSTAGEAPTVRDASGTGRETLPGSREQR